MLIDKAEVILKWSSGKTVRIGTIDMEADKDVILKAKIKHIQQRLGWELVRNGFAMMFMGRKRKKSWRQEKKQKGADT